LKLHYLASSIIAAVSNVKMNNSNLLLVTQQTIDQFKMLRDGDKVLVCMSGSSSSMCLMHLLRQFIRARGWHVELGTITIGDDIGVDPRALMLYFRDLSTEYIYEAFDGAMSLRSKIAMIARRKGYNVIAFGTTLDKLADDVVKSILYNGKLYSIAPCAKHR
jgi:hypothetical protein